MNNARRKALSEAVEIITFARDEEQEAFENLPENLQYSERGERMEESIASLDEALDAIEAAVEGI